MYFSLGTTRTVRPLSAGAETRLIQTLRRIEQFYTYHGINLRTCYEDFDRHHMGVVTESQVRLDLKWEPFHWSVVERLGPV